MPVSLVDNISLFLSFSLSVCIALSLSLVTIKSRGSEWRVAIGTLLDTRYFYRRARLHTGPVFSFLFYFYDGYGNNLTSPMKSLGLIPWTNCVCCLKWHWNKLSLIIFWLKLKDLKSCWHWHLKQLYKVMRESFFSLFWKEKKFSINAQRARSFHAKEKKYIAIFLQIFCYP